MTAFIAPLVAAALLVLAFPLIVRVLVRWRLGPDRVVIEGTPGPHPPCTKPLKVAVIGGGLAGIGAASTLAERGIDVVLFEANAHLGGKIKSWPVTLPNGEQTWLCHGYHAFFRHYHNLNRYLDRRSLRNTFESVGDYVIIEKGGHQLSFEGIATTPILNLLSLARRGVFSLRQIVFGPARDLMGIFLEYDRELTFERLDHISFDRFARDAALPRRLRLAFGTFARAFFADEDRMSLAELVKCFHFYFLSHDGGLVYDYPAGDYEQTIIGPIRADLAASGVRLELATPVRKLAFEADRFTIEGELFDQVVIATNVVGAREIVTGATGLADDLTATFAELRPGQRYAVLRVWLDRPLQRDLPVFVITERERFLDAVAICDRYEPDATAWAKNNNGAVLELHCYAVPDDAPDDATIRDGLLAELKTVFEELRGASVWFEDHQVRRDFSAFHVGCHAQRPRVGSATPGLFFAGDWVSLEFPAMLMEGAFTSGVVAANRILERVGEPPALVESVPLRGVMAGMPWPPARDQWVASAAGVPSSDD